MADVDVAAALIERGAMDPRSACALVAALFLAACPSEPKPLPPARPALPPEPRTVLAPPREDGRLPTLATPQRYELSFDVDPSRATFHGTARIDVDVTERTSFVVLHASGLRIAKAKATGARGTVDARAETRVAHGTSTPEELVLSFEHVLPPGKAQLALEWEGSYGSDLAGLYRVEDGGQWYAFTQFEPTDARRAFPCFDEPGFKVPFDVSVSVPKGLVAVANSPETTREEGPQRTTFRFATTPPLPTYLVALAVGDLEIREAKRERKPSLRLIAPKGKTSLGALALETTATFVDGLADWFGIPYPYAKLDIVAVPDFAAGAMENAGLITFRDELLLLDPARASARARRAQADVVAHELAHQWMGNLVTAAWWDDLWLNEGMATWMTSRIVERLKPAFGARRDAVASTLAVMDHDALVSARAVRQPVTSVAEAREAFDGITYQKGAAILSTVEAWIGEPAFQRGVRMYLEGNAHKNANAEKLLSSLSLVSGKDVLELASGYLDRPGVPDVSVQLTCERGARWSAELTQEPWRPLGSAQPEQSDRTWTIPVCVRAQGEKKNECAELAAGAPSLVAGKGRCPQYVHPNIEVSYYRYFLPEKDLLKLAAGRDLDVNARLAVLSNAWASVRSGKLPASTMLKVLPAFDEDRAKQVVEQVIGVLHGMSEMLVEDEARPAFRAFAATRLLKRKRALGWLPQTGETPEDALLRRSVLMALGDIADDEVTLREADELAAKWIADPASVDSDTAGAALELASRHAGASRLAQLREIAKKGKTREDRILALKAMMAFDDRAVLEAALSLSLGDEIRARDMRYVLGTALSRRAHKYVAEEWIRGHWGALRTKLPGALGRGLVYAAAIACTKAQVDERAAFYTAKAAEIEGAKRILASSLESASLCAELRAHAAAGFSRTLMTQKP